jgi:hypothetical protein
MTVRELVELNQMITDIEITVRVGGSALLDALFIGPAVGEKPRYPLTVPKDRRYVGNMNVEYRKEATYNPKSVNSWDDGKDYWQVKPDRIPSGWRDLEVYSWEVWFASTVCHTSPRRHNGKLDFPNASFHGQRINIVALPSGEKLPDPEECKAKTDDQEQLKGQMSLEEFLKGG